MTTTNKTSSVDIVECHEDEPRSLLVDVPDHDTGVRTLYRTASETDLTESERALVVERMGLAAYLSYPLLA